MKIHQLTGRLQREWRHRGTAGTARFLLGRILRRRRHVVFEAALDGSWTSPEWRPDEHMLSFGPDNVDADMTPALRNFLGGDEAVENIDGVRRGNRLFVVANGRGFLHCGYILFNARGARLIGETSNPPLIACCMTAPAARGRGLYPRALQAELCFLQAQGYRRAVIETDPENLASQRGIERAGFRLCRRATTWTLMNWLVCQHTDGPAGRSWRLFLA